jgi:cardiolipin synthase A/B
MGKSTTGGRARRSFAAIRKCVGRGVLAALVGCRSPGPALPYAAGPGESGAPRHAVLMRQVAADSAVEVTHHPIRTGQAVLAETADHVTALCLGEFGKRVVLPLRDEPTPLTEVPPSPVDLTCLERNLERLTGQPLRPANVQLYPDGAQALATLEQLIAQATTRIDIIMFYWDNDALGNALAEQLLARAGPSLHVRILIDGGGNLLFGEPGDASAAHVNGAVARLLHHPYIEVVRIRNPFARFDHRKLVLIDGQVAWTGGRNFDWPAFYRVHDLSFTLEGELVCELQRRFEDYWRDQGGQQSGGDHNPSDFQETIHAPVSRACHEATPVEAAPPVNAAARLVFTEPGGPGLARTLYRAVDAGREHVYLANVYFNDSRLMVKLAAARRRGADVRVLLTFDSVSDTIARANRVAANRLLQAGVRVYIYPGKMHVKAASVDGCWAYLGTGNFDALSFRHNREMALAVSGGALVAELEERLFRKDFRAEWELHQPVPITLHDYFAELLASLAL